MAILAKRPLSSVSSLQSILMILPQHLTKIPDRKHGYVDPSNDLVDRRGLEERNLLLRDMAEHNLEPIEKSHFVILHVTKFKVGDINDGLLFKILKYLVRF